MMMLRLTCPCSMLPECWDVSVPACLRWMLNTFPLHTPLP
jgi:hypothetical protein